MSLSQEFMGSVSLAITTLLGILIFFRDKKKVDVDADTTIAATDLKADEQSVNAALRLRDAAIADRDRLENRLQKVEEREKVRDRKVNLLSNEVYELKTELVNTRRIWRDWANDLHRRWEYHRTQDSAPAPPVSNYYDDGQDVDLSEGRI